MAKTKQKKRRDKKRVVETALPKRQYKRTNRLLYVFSGILLVVFGGGAALLGAGVPKGGATPTQAPRVSTPLPAAAGTPAATSAPAGATPAPTNSQPAGPTSTGALTAPTPTPPPAAPTSAP